ncbi:hypothetical protein K4F52_007359 [Lecanicillium sp. MT-2017a]|nr:hypothetical protein K4F52_007359 [Lecanicillium sp. MT-2017a]
MSDNTNGPGVAQRRGSITQAALSNLFQRGPSNGNGSFSGPSNGAADPRSGRRLSVTTIGLSGTSPTTPATFMRRGSISTNSSIDESAIEDDDGLSKTAPTTPFVRRVSFGASGSGANSSNSTMRGYRPSGSPGNGNNNPTSPPAQLGRRQSTQKSPPVASAGWSASASVSGRRPSSVLSSSLPQASFTMHPRATSDNPVSRADQQGFNWSEQLRSRAESSVSAASRPSFSLSSSPPRAGPAHDRTRSVSDMPQPPAQAAAVQQPRQQPKPKPDAFQERILKGDFYMD